MHMKCHFHCHLSLPPLWCTVTPSLPLSCVPKISQLFPILLVRCNDASFSPSGSVYQEEEEVSKICYWLKGTQCFKMQSELRRRQGDGESVSHGSVRTLCESTV